MAGADEFAWYDYLTFVLTLLISIGVGVFFNCTGGKQKTTDEYLLADRKLGVLPVTLSMVMSYLSAILVLGNSAEMYTYGIQMWWNCVGQAIAMVIGALVFIPLFFPLKLISSLEYFEIRFKSRAVRLIGTFFSLMSGCLYMGLAMYAPSTALEAVSPIPWWATILLMGSISMIYTSMGGMKAVVWADVIQAAIYIFGLLAVLVLGLVEVGGFGPMWAACEDGGRLYMEFTLDPIIRASFWSAVLGYFFTGLSKTGTSQVALQRYASMQSVSQAKLAGILVAPLTVLMYIVTYLIGMCVFAYYHMEGCDPLRTGKVSNTNQLLPYFVVNALNVPGLPGLFVAILFSGALSSVSSSMNANATVTWKDLCEPYLHDVSERTKTTINKLLSLMYGVIAIGLGIGFNYFPGHVMMVTSTVNAAAFAPICGLFILGALFPCANAKGAIVGAAVGFSLDFLISIGNSLTRPWAQSMNTTVYSCPENTTISDKPLQGNDDYMALWGLAYSWYTAIGVLTTVLVGFLVSLCTGPDTPSEQDPRVVAPVCDRLCCCLPECARSPCRCDVDYDEILYDGDGNFLDNDKGSMSSSDLGLSDMTFKRHSLTSGVVARQRSIRGSYIYQDSFYGNGVVNTSMDQVYTVDKEQGI